MLSDGGIERSAEYGALPWVLSGALKEKPVKNSTAIIRFFVF